MGVQIIFVVVCFLLFLCIVILQQVRIVYLQRKNVKLSDRVDAYQEMYDVLKRRKKAEQEETNRLLDVVLKYGNKELVGYYFCDLEKRRQDILTNGGSFDCLGAIERIQEQANVKNKNLGTEQIQKSNII